MITNPVSVSRLRYTTKHGNSENGVAATILFTKGFRALLNSKEDQTHGAGFLFQVRLKEFIAGALSAVEQPGWKLPCKSTF